MKPSEIWCVYSDRKEVKEPTLRSIKQVDEGVGRRIGPKPEVLIHRYIVDEAPYRIDMAEDQDFVEHVGRASGFGDLWHWSWYCTFSEEKAKEFYQKETKRIQKYKKF
jgi:hypothetical protein